MRHAVSIDERRAFFRQNLFGVPNGPHQDIKEVWFAGVHSDVGGGYAESESQLSQIALRWMICEAEKADLAVDPRGKTDILGGEPPYDEPDPRTANQHESLNGKWWIAEIWPKIVHLQNIDRTWRTSIRLNLGRRRTIADNSLVHESVVQRLADAGVQYRPSNLPEQRQIVRDKYETRFLSN